MATDYTQHANCVAAWLFKEGSGTSVADSSSASNTGTFKGSGEPAWSTTVPTYGLGGSPLYTAQFDGSDDVIACGTSNSILPQSTACTIVAWVRVSDASANQRIIDRDNVHFNIIYGLILFTSLGSTSTYRNSANSVVSNDTWTHFAVTWDGSTTATGIKFYKNGVETSYGTNQDGASPTSNAGSTTRLGNRSDGARCLTGYMTEVGVFNAVMSTDAITEIYNYGLTGSIYVPRIMVLI